MKTLKTILALTVLASAATVLAPAASADTFIVSASAAGEETTVTHSTALDACRGYAYMTHPSSPVQSSGSGDGTTCTSRTVV